MAFDPRALTQILGAVGGLRGGSNAFSRRWQQLEAMDAQRRAQEQQMAQQGQMQQQQMGMQRERLDLDRATQDRLAEQQRMGYTQSLQQLFTDENVDPDVALQLATMAPPPGYDVDAVRSMHARTFTPDKRTQRIAAKRLKDIEADPQIKRLLQAGEDVSTVMFEAPDLGGNPEDPQGAPRYTVAQLQRLAQKPVAASPLPKVTATSQQPNTPEERLADAMRRGDQGEVDILTKAAETISGARRAPEDPALSEIRQLRLEQARAGSQSTALPPATQRRVDMKARAFDAQPVVKRIQTMAEAVQFSEGLNQNTTNPADDQALIYAFAKAMDPDSVVREGEYATVQKYAQSWAERFGFDVARIFSNTVFLTPQARQNMKSTIRARYSAARPQYDNLRRSHAKQINQITGRGDGETYLVDYAAGFPNESQQAPGPATGGSGAVVSYQDYLRSRSR